MSKWLIKGINMLIGFIRISILALWVSFILPLSYLYYWINGGMKNYVLTDSDFLMPIVHHVPSVAAISSFPTGVYCVVMIIGTTVTTVGSLIFARTLLRLMNKMLAHEYFSVTNTTYLKRLFQAQIVVSIGSVFVASGNQLTSSWLSRINQGLGVDWSTVLGNFIGMLFCGLIYVLFSQAVDMKRDNDLTI